MAGNPLLNMMSNGGPMGMMQNNHILQLVNMVKSGKGNPMQMIQQMAGQNSQMNEVMKMLNGKDETQMKDLMNKTAKEKGVDLSQLAKNIGMPADVAARFGINMD